MKDFGYCADRDFLEKKGVIRGSENIFNETHLKIEVRRCVSNDSNPDFCNSAYDIDNIL